MGVGILPLVVAALLLAPIGLLWAFQRRLIYLPAPRAVPLATSVLPGAEEVTFAPADGLRLGGWFVPARPELGRPDRRGRADLWERPSPGATRPDLPQRVGPAVLVCNGNGGNRSLRAALAAELSRMGLAVLLFDYRGY